MSGRRAVGLLVRLVVYYGALAGVAWALGPQIPRWGDFFAPRAPGGAAVAMLGALALMSPIAWLYMRTKPKARYDSSLVQTVIILPVVIAGVVLIVRDSVALAFSLAGIVAAVRFRNTLRDTKDAVYIFLAIAVGLSTGVQSFAVGFMVSVIYVAVVLVLWRFDVGASPSTVTDRVRGRLVVEATGAPATEAAITGILDRHARRWKLLHSAPTGLTFAVQLRRRSSADALVAAVRGAAALPATGVRFEPRLT